MVASGLVLDKLRCERDDRPLFEQLSASFAPGTITRIDGPNGAGKTTLLRILAGLYRADEGQIFWHGALREQVLEDFQASLLYLGHRPAVKASLTPLENLRALVRLRRQVDDHALRDALQQLGLRGYEDVPAHQLSAGQQRRIALARLPLSCETLWLLDEAFTAIDRQGVSELEQRLAAHARDGGIVVLTTHHELSALSGLARLTLGRQVSA